MLRWRVRKEALNCGLYIVSMALSGDGKDLCVVEFDKPPQWLIDRIAIADLLGIGDHSDMGIRNGRFTYVFFRPIT